MSNGPSGGRQKATPPSAGLDLSPDGEAQAKSSEAADPIKGPMLAPADQEVVSALTGVPAANAASRNGWFLPASVMLTSDPIGTTVGASYELRLVFMARTITAASRPVQGETHL